MTATQIVLVLLLAVGTVSIVCAAFGAYVGGQRIGRRRLDSEPATGADPERLRQQMESAASTAAAAREEAHAAREAQAAAADRIGLVEDAVAELRHEVRRSAPVPVPRSQRGQVPERAVPGDSGDDTTPEDSQDRRSEAAPAVEVIRSPNADRLRGEPTASIVELGLRFAGSIPTGRGRLVGVIRWTTGIPTATIPDPVSEFLAGYAADRLVAAGWPVSTEAWDVVDPGRYDHAASAVDSLQGLMQELLLGRPVAAGGAALGLRAVPVAPAAEVAAAPPLAGDRKIGSVVTLIQVTGAVVGVALGHPILTVACVKSLTRSAVTSTVTKAIRQIATGPVDLDTAAAPGGQPPTPSAPAGPTGPEPDGPASPTPGRRSPGVEAALRDVRGRAAARQPPPSSPSRRPEPPPDQPARQPPYRPDRSDRPDRPTPGRQPRPGRRPGIGGVGR